MVVATAVSRLFLRMHLNCPSQHKSRTTYTSESDAPDLYEQSLHPDGRESFLSDATEMEQCRLKLTDLEADGGMGK